MGYFDQYLKRLREEFEDVLKEDDLSVFQKIIFEEKCTFESIPRQFLILIEFASKLLLKIRELLQYKTDTTKNQSIDSKKNEADSNYNKYDNAGFELAKPIRAARFSRSSSLLGDTPLQMTAETFSYFSVNDLIFVKNFRSRRLMNAAVKNVKLYKSIKLVLDTSQIEAIMGSNEENMKCNEIVALITTLHFEYNVNEYNQITSKGIEPIVKMVKHCGSVEKVLIEGYITPYLIDSPDFWTGLSMASDNICVHLRYIEFITHGYAILNENFWKYIRRHSWKLKNIEMITITLKQSNQKIEYRKE